MLAYRTDYGRGTPWYVSQLPARPGTKRALRDGVDWGYTTTPEGKESWDHEQGKMVLLDKAIHLSPYWQRRFRKDCERTGTVAHFL